jgi:hypothetical protein
MPAGADHANATHRLRMKISLRARYGNGQRCVLIPGSILQ